jgi:hypothetical protein
MLFPHFVFWFFGIIIPIAEKRKGKTFYDKDNNTNVCIIVLLVVFRLNRQDFGDKFYLPTFAIDVSIQ